MDKIAIHFRITWFNILVFSFFLSFSNFSIAKDVYLINGKIYIRNPRASATRRGSSSEYRPGIDTATVLLNGP